MKRNFSGILSTSITTALSNKPTISLYQQATAEFLFSHVQPYLETPSMTVQQQQELGKLLEHRKQVYVVTQRDGAAKVLIPAVENVFYVWKKEGLGQPQHEIKVQEIPLFNTRQQVEPRTKYHDATYQLFSIETLPNLITMLVDKAFNKAKAFNPKIDESTFEAPTQFRLRYVLTPEMKLVFADEGPRTKLRPGHGDMTDNLFVDARCVAAGNIILTKDMKIIMINNKSGDFKPEFDLSMVWALGKLLANGFSFAPQLLVERHIRSEKKVQDTQIVDTSKYAPLTTSEPSSTKSVELFEIPTSHLKEIIKNKFSDEVWNSFSKENQMFFVRRQSQTTEQVEFTQAVQMLSQDALSHSLPTTAQSKLETWGLNFDKEIIMPKTPPKEAKKVILDSNIVSEKVTPNFG